MEILFISHKYPPVIGGMEKQSFELITGMKKHVRIHAIIFDPEKESRIHFFRHLEAKIVAMVLKYPLITIIHFNDALVATVCLRHKHYRHLKHTMTVHGLDVVYPNWIYRKWIFKQFNRFSLIFAVSAATALECIARGIHKERVVVVHNGVDHTMPAAPSRIQMEALLSSQYGIEIERKRILIAMGRPVRRKGFSWFIDQVMPKLEPDIILLLIGPGQRTANQPRSSWRFVPAVIRVPFELLMGTPTDAERISKLVANPKMSGVVKQLGVVLYENLLKLMRSADAFIMPNIAVKGDMEGFGLVCLEAALCGAPVYAAAIDGITDVIHHGQNGVLLPSADAPTWVKNINNLGKGKGDMPSREDAISYTTKHFGWTKMVQEYQYYFSKL